MEKEKRKGRTHGRNRGGEIKNTGRGSPNQKNYPAPPETLATKGREKNKTRGAFLPEDQEEMEAIGQRRKKSIIQKGPI